MKGQTLSRVTSLLLILGITWHHETQAAYTLNFEVFGYVQDFNGANVNAVLTDPNGATLANLTMDHNGDIITSGCRGYAHGAIEPVSMESGVIYGLAISGQACVQNSAAVKFRLPLSSL